MSQSEVICITAYGNFFTGVTPDSTGSEDCNSGSDSTGSEYCNSGSDSTDGEKCSSLKFSTGHKDFVSFETSSIDTYCGTCETGKSGGYFNTVNYNRSGEDYSGFEDCDRGKNKMTMKTLIDIKPKFIGIDKYKQKVKQLQRLSFIIVVAFVAELRDFIILLGF